MSDEKLKLPTDQTEILKTQRAGINASAKVEVAKLQNCKEAITLAKAVFDVLKSHNELESTRLEWEGRVSAAETSVKKAEVDLQTAKEQNKLRMGELEQSREIQNRLLLLFDEIMKEFTDAELSDEARKEMLQNLLQLSDKIVLLKK